MYSLKHSPVFHPVSLSVFWASCESVLHSTKKMLRKENTVSAPLSRIKFFQMLFSERMSTKHRVNRTRCRIRSMSQTIVLNTVIKKPVALPCYSAEVTHTHTHTTLWNSATPLYRRVTANVQPQRFLVHDSTLNVKDITLGKELCRRWQKNINK